MNLKLTAIISYLQQNKRLLWGILLILLILLVYGFLLWQEATSGKEKQLLQINQKISTLQSQAKQEKKLAENLASLQAVKDQFATRVWQAKSEAAAQARMQDWLGEILTKAKISVNQIKVANSRALTVTDEEGKPYSELSASFSFLFTPQALDNFIAEIEASEYFASIGSLKVLGNERRVDVTVHLLIQINPNSQALPESLANKENLSSNNQQLIAKTSTTATSAKASDPVTNSNDLRKRSIDVSSKLFK